MSAHGCIHLTNFKNGKGTHSFRVIHAYFIACITEESRRKKARACICQTCRSHAPRLHACLHCVYFGCYGAKHIHEHARNKKHFLEKCNYNLKIDAYSHYFST
ncbi:ubiquitin carboxyl-terminal hydrolase 22-like [Centruroides sculpturatus]|uniref:ubiquitin carboxyl-terminal hydrolase 22-like n=1 Tax=Centruroides sculpturatus TaxID=218467 RepID=UPI000C6E675E|nr:ubiquitin carboxyl-terminal hydrolase 22-like [Centruroides sculpturatus]